MSRNAFPGFNEIVFSSATDSDIFPDNKPWKFTNRFEHVENANVLGMIGLTEIYVSPRRIPITVASVVTDTVADTTTQGLKCVTARAYTRDANTWVEFNPAGSIADVSFDMQYNTPTALAPDFSDLVGEEYDSSVISKIIARGTTMLQSYNPACAIDFNGALFSQVSTDAPMASAPVSRQLPWDGGDVDTSVNGTWAPASCSAMAPTQTATAFNVLNYDLMPPFDLTQIGLVQAKFHVEWPSAGNIQFFDFAYSWESMDDLTYTQTFTVTLSDETVVKVEVPFVLHKTNQILFWYPPSHWQLHEPLRQWNISYTGLNPKVFLCPYDRVSVPVLTATTAYGPEGLDFSPTNFPAGDGWKTVDASLGKGWVSNPVGPFTWELLPPSEKVSALSTTGGLVKTTKLLAARAHPYAKKFYKQELTPSLKPSSCRVGAPYEGTSPHWYQILCDDLELDRFAGGHSAPLLKFLYVDQFPAYTSSIVPDESFSWKAFTNRVIQNITFQIADGSGQIPERLALNQDVVTIRCRFTFQHQEK